MLCTLNLFFFCAPSDDWTSLGLSLYSFIILTGFVSIDSWPEIESYMFVGFWLCVSSFLVTNELHIQNTFGFHKVVAEQVVKDLVVNKVPSKKILSRTWSSTIPMGDYE